MPAVWSGERSLLEASCGPGAVFPGGLGGPDPLVPTQELSVAASPFCSDLPEELSPLLNTQLFLSPEIPSDLSRDRRVTSGGEEIP